MPVVHTEGWKVRKTRKKNELKNGRAVYVCVCVCVRKSRRKKEREGGRKRRRKWAGFNSEVRSSSLPPRGRPLHPGFLMSTESGYLLVTA